MARIIEARVIQKVDTEANWMANELILYKGEIALVGDPDRVYNIKVGNGFKKFRDLPYMVNYVNGLYTGIITPQSQVPSGVNNVFLVSEQGTYTNFGGVVLPKDNLGIIYKNGNNFTIQLIPIVSEENLQEYIDEKLVDINVGFGGEISTLNQSPNVQGMYIPKVSGVYPNFGNLEYDPIEGFTLFLYKDSQFSKVVVPLNSVEGYVEFNNNALGVSGSAVEKYAVKKINIIADLRNTNGEYEGQIITLLGYYDKGDKEPLNYKWTNTKGVDDGGSVINSNNGSWMAVFGDKVNVKHYGAFPEKNENETTDCINNAIKTNLNIFISKGIYNIRGHNPSTTTNDYLRDEGGIEMLDNTTLLMEKGVVLKQVATSLKQYNVIRIYNKKNVKIEGGEILGDRESHTGSDGEWGYGIAISGGENISIKNLKVSNLWGDGINIQHVNVNNETEISKNILLENIISDNNRRQGMSIEGGDGLYFYNCEFVNTNGTPPQCGVDIEPWHSESIVKNVLFYKCKFNNNNHAGLLMGGSANVSNIEVIECEANGNKIITSVGGQITSYQSNNNIIIENCKIKGNVNSLYGISMFESNNSIVNNNKLIDCMFNIQGIGATNNIKFISNDVTFVNEAISGDVNFMSDDRNQLINTNILLRNNIVNIKNNVNLYIYLNITNSIVEGNIFNSYNYISLKGTDNVIKNNQFNNSKYSCFSSKRLSDRCLILNNIFSGSINGDGGSSFVIIDASNNLVISNNIVSKQSKYNNNISNYTKAFYIDPNINNLTFNNNVNIGLEMFPIDAKPNPNNNNVYLFNSDIEFRGYQKTSENVSNITTDDASDLATAVALVNELKNKLNSKLTSDRNSGQQAIQ